MFLVSISFMVFPWLDDLRFSRQYSPLNNAQNAPNYQLASFLGTTMRHLLWLADRNLTTVMIMNNITFELNKLPINLNSICLFPIVRIAKTYYRCELSPSVEINLSAFCKGMISIVWATVTMDRWSGEIW